MNAGHAALVSGVRVTRPFHYKKGQEGVWRGLGHGL